MHLDRKFGLSLSLSEITTFWLKSVLRPNFSSAKG